MGLKINEISIYPIKSLGAVELEKSEIRRKGLRWDRRFVLVDGEGKFVTQRENTLLATVKVKLTSQYLSVRSGNRVGPRIEFSRLDDLFVEPRTVRVWNSLVEALIAVEPINDWFREALNSDYKLAFMPSESERPINAMFDKGKEIVSFADGYPLLLTNRASLEDLNSRLDSPVTMDRFRANLFVDGADAFEEDNWKRIQVGPAVFRVTKPCARCVITTIDQASGVKLTNEPLRTLAGYRKASQVYPENFRDFDMGANDVLFGINLVPENAGESIAVGDSVRVLD